MPSIETDEITYKKLLLAKQVNNRGVMFSTSHYKFDHLMAVIMFDFAIETMIKTAIRSLNPSFNSNKNFHKIIEDYEKEKKDEMPDKTNVLFVHKKRNSAQHDATIPTQETVNDCRTYTRDFLEKVSKDMWNKDFNEISLIDLIEDAKIRDKLESAEEALDCQNYQKAIEKTSEGLNLLISQSFEKIAGKTAQITKEYGLSEGIDNITFRLFNVIKTNQEMNFFNTLNINYLHYLKYRQIVNNSVQNLDDANYVYSFCLDTIIRIEKNVSNLSVN